MDLNEQLLGVVRHINSRYVAEIPRDILAPSELPRNFPGTNQDRYLPVTTTMLLLNTVLGNNTLLEGDPGTGKTTLARVVGTLASGMPYDYLEERMPTGLANLEINDMIGTHNVASINQGKDEAYLYMGLHSPYLIVDEINRFDPNGQNILREGISTGVYKYVNHSWRIPGQVVVAAINPPEYEGTFPMAENLLDNFTCSLEPPHYNELLHEAIIMSSKRAIEESLTLPEELEKLREEYAKKSCNFDEIASQIELMRKAMLTQMKDSGEVFLDPSQHSEIRDQVDRIEFSSEAALLKMSVLSELKYGSNYGRIRRNDPQHTEIDNTQAAYMGSHLRVPLEGRFFQDFNTLAKGLAWLLGSNQVDQEHLKAAFIYSSAHRIVLTDTMEDKFREEPRLESASFYKAKKLIELGFENYSNLSHTGNTGFTKLRQIISSLAKGDIQSEDAMQVLENIEHPMALMVRDALGISQIEGMQGDF